MTPLPESPYCRVRARVATIWAEGPDEGTNPDWRPAVGERVTLTPSIGEQLLVFDVAGPAPIIVTVERVQCEVDADGWLVHADGRPVFIAPTDDPTLSATGWTWTATIKSKTIAFSAPAGGVVDLALFIATPAIDAVEYVSVVQIVADYLTANPPTAVSDHGALTGLADDDHPQYHTDARGDARYSPLGHGHTIAAVSGLQSALDGKQVAGSYAPALGADDHYVTDAEKVKLGNLSGTNTGDQTLPTWITIAGKPAVVAAGADAAAARAAIGAGTSNLTLGTTASTAKAGNYSPPAASETAQGIVELATTAETTTGTNTARAVTPAGVKAVADTKADANHSHAYADLTDKPTIPDSPDDIGAAPATHTHTAADIDSGADTDGHVLTADGTGGAGWSPVPVTDLSAYATKAELAAAVGDVEAALGVILS